MKRSKAAIALAAGLMFSAGCSACETLNESPTEEIKTLLADNTSAPYAERVGITNWGAMYMPSLPEEKTSLLYGAEKILESGGKVIKVACGDPKAQYPLDDWSGESFSACVDVLKNARYAELFRMGFKTFFISITEQNRAKYADGMSEEERVSVEREFYEATKYLLETYRGSGKTFILQNWETDNYVRYSFDGADEVIVLRRYAEYFNVRQDGINRAREEFGMDAEKDVFVFGALEVNKLDDSYAYCKAVDYVVPYTYADLYAYSSYEYKDKEKFRTAEEISVALRAAMEYYRSKLPDKKRYPQPVYFGDNRLAITEFGYPDRADGYSGEWQKIVAEGHLLALDACRLQYAVYWQLCCNELVGDNASDIKKLSPTALRAYNFSAGDLNGFYLLRPDGAETYTLSYLKEVFKSNSRNAEGKKISAWQ